MFNEDGQSGRDPTPETIRQGTVRMEEHPQYAQTIAAIEARGYNVVFVKGIACVVVREVVNQQGQILRLEREVQVRPGMAYLDLEHEIGHIDQIEQRLKEDMLPTERVLESGRQSSNQSDLYHKWMDVISEYHNRLVEYKRLNERGVEEDILAGHAQQVRVWREKYTKIVLAIRRGSRDAASRLAWGQKFFPDIEELAAAYQDAGGDKLERDLRL